MSQQSGQPGAKTVSSVKLSLLSLLRLRHPARMAPGHSIYWSGYARINKLASCYLVLVQIITVYEMSFIEPLLTLAWKWVVILLATQHTDNRTKLVNSIFKLIRYTIELGYFLDQGLMSWWTLASLDGIKVVPGADAFQYWCDPILMRPQSADQLN